MADDVSSLCVQDQSKVQKWLGCPSPFLTLHALLAQGGGLGIIGAKVTGMSWADWLAGLRAGVTTAVHLWLVRVRQGALVAVVICDSDTHITRGSNLQPLWGDSPARRSLTLKLEGIVGWTAHPGNPGGRSVLHLMGFLQRSSSALSLLQPPFCFCPSVGESVRTSE